MESRSCMSAKTEEEEQSRKGVSQNQRLPTLYSAPRSVKRWRRRVRERRGQPKYITNNENSGDQKQITNITEVKRVIRSLPPSSSSGSNISSSTTSNVEEVKQNQNKHQANAAVNKKTAEMDCYIIYLVLADMIFTVFWGKLGGILCTSVWLYCHPHRRSSCSASRQTNRSSRSLRQSPETKTRRESLCNKDLMQH